MTEFGHVSSYWVTGPFTLKAGDRSFSFEDSGRFGPLLLRKDGEVRHHCIPSEKSPFWPAWQKWRDQGRQLADDGITCVWSEDQ